ncbi:MAG TPA: glycosyltransferase [Phycisphaerales bacterium]|nr:glycosyltransferase [Phycisphaerales bacterium]
MGIAPHATPRVLMPTDRPRILHLTMEHGADDARVYGKEVLSLLEKYGEIHLACPPASDASWRPAAGVVWHELPWYRGPSSWPSCWRAATRVVRSIPGPRIVHTHEPESAVAARLFGWCDPSRLIYDAHEYYPALRSSHRGALRGWLLRRVFSMMDSSSARSAGCVIAVDEDLAAHYARRGVEAAVVSNACGMIPESALRADRDGGRVVYAGGLSRARGIDVLLDAARRLIGAGVDLRLDLAGAVIDPAIGEAIASAAAEFPDRVRHLGVLRHDEVLSLLGETSIGVIPFRRVPFYTGRPVKLLEYAMTGNSVVATDQGPKADFVRAHGCGAVVPPGDAGALADALAERIGDPELARAEGARARSAAVSLCWEAVDRPVLLSVYERLLAIP